MNALILAAVLGQWGQVNPCQPNFNMAPRVDPRVCQPNDPNCQTQDLGIFYQGRSAEYQMRASSWRNMQTKDPNIVMVVGSEGPSKKNPTGNGFVVLTKDDYAFIVTVAHVITGCVEYSVEYPGIGKVPAELIGVNAQLDTAVLYAKDMREKRSIVSFGEDTPKVGTRVQITGWYSEYPNGRTRRTLRFVQGQITEMDSTLIMYTRTNAEVASGYSGSPVIAVLPGSVRSPVLGMLRAKGPNNEAECVKGIPLAAYVFSVIDEYNLGEQEEQEEPPLPESKPMVEIQETQETKVDIEVLNQKIEEAKYDDTGLRREIENLRNLVLSNVEVIENVQNGLSELELKWESLDPAVLVKKEELNARLDELYTITDVTQVDGTVLRQKRKLGEPTHIKAFPISEKEKLK